MRTFYADLILVGASLSHCLLALFIKRRHPKTNILMLEREASIPAGRTWSFHLSDVGENFTTISDLITREWPGYDIRLPHLARSFDSAYACIRPERLQKAVNELLSESLLFSCPVEEVRPESVRLADGRTVFAECVLDSRKIAQPEALIGYQKFIGLYVKLARPHGLQAPILLDACRPQIDGFRFFYTLPWSTDELLIEDTCYSSNPVLDVDLYTTEIENYALRMGWSIETINEREQGVLPIPLHADYFAEQDPARVGVAGGFFHPVTGYSLPTAVELASRISSLDHLNRSEILKKIRTFRNERESRIKFSCRLNRMMFMAARPSERFQIFEHFYSLPESTIQRFYADKINISDRLRILCGKPPVKISAALHALAGQGLPL